MMRKLFYILFIFIGLTCCDKKEESHTKCETSNPLKELLWLKEFKEALTNCQIEISIFQAIYNNEVVFYTFITDPRVISVFGVTLWDCEGDIVRVFDYDEAGIFRELVTNREVLYRCTTIQN